VKPVEVRTQLVDAIRLDLVGPDNRSDLEAEMLPQAPSRWGTSPAFWSRSILPSRKRSTRPLRTISIPRSLDQEQAKKATLHAKCIAIDNEIAFISSANFTEAA
jgi:phosphatidylserine/phosphatidylglycerophosphate/cardiolipin synthase-like enzyme